VGALARSGPAARDEFYTQALRPTTRVGLADVLGCHQVEEEGAGLSKQVLCAAPKVRRDGTLDEEAATSFFGLT